MRAIVDLFFPPTCLSCDRPVRAPELCSSCVTRMPGIADACHRCGDVGCRGCAPPWISARAVAAYDGVVRDAVLRFKLGGERRAAQWMGERMAQTLPDEPGVITHVPSWPPTRRQRGFDPAELLAKHVARVSSTTRRDLLRKVRETRDSAGLTKGARRSNLNGSFAAVDDVPSVVTLIDDIMTTGATAAVCAEALLAAGCVRVHVVTFARTLRR